MLWQLTQLFLHRSTHVPSNPDQLPLRLAGAISNWHSPSGSLYDKSFSRSFTTSMTILFGFVTFNRRFIIVFARCLTEIWRKRPELSEYIIFVHDFFFPVLVCLTRWRACKPKDSIPTDTQELGCCQVLISCAACGNLRLKPVRGGGRIGKLFGAWNLKVLSRLLLSQFPSFIGYLSAKTVDD